VVSEGNRLVRFARTAAATAVLAALLIPTTAHAAPAAEPGATITAPVREVLARLPVRSEDRTGYERNKFKQLDRRRQGRLQHEGYLHASIRVERNAPGAWGSYRSDWW
jgi:hypothetical protein